MTFDKTTGFYFLNVGQGDASIIKQSGLIGFVDGGPDYSADYFLDNLSPFYNCRIDFVIISHPHMDHIGGFKRILERCSVDHMIYYKQAYTSQIWSNVLDSFLSTSSVLEAPAGTRLSFNDRLELSFLWPKGSGDCVGDVNDCSLVVLVQGDSFKVLYTGDVSVKIGGVLTSGDVNKEITSVDVLKMAHHGGKGTVSSDFVAKLQPKQAVVSYGKGNKYGHPASETLSIMELAGVPVSHTSKGLVLVKTPE